MEHDYFDITLTVALLVIVGLVTPKKFTQIICNLLKRLMYGLAVLATFASCAKDDPYHNRIPTREWQQWQSLCRKAQVKTIIQ